MSSKNGGGLLVVGSVAFDHVRTPHGERAEVLGGAATFFSVAASILYQPVHLVAVVGSDFPAEHIQMLEERRISCAGLSRVDGATFRWKGYYEGDMNMAVTEETHLNVFGDFKPVLPESLRKPDYLFLANIDPELQLDVLDQVDRPRMVAADTMNHWISSKPDVLRRLISRVDLMLISEAEATQLTKSSNLIVAARAILQMGPKVVIIKKGEDGALLVSGSANPNHADSGDSGIERMAIVPAYPLDTVIDPTGAGDSFGGGLMAEVAREGGDHRDFELLKRAAAYGSVIASFNCESFSMERMKLVTAAEVDDRFEKLRTLAAF